MESALYIITIFVIFCSVHKKIVGKYMAKIILYDNTFKTKMEMKLTFNLIMHSSSVR